MSYKVVLPFTVPFYVQKPKWITEKGSPKKHYSKSDDLIMCSFRSFGGTEIKTDAGIVVEDTAIIETWFRPDITSDCRLQSAQDGLCQYEILGTPENIDMLNQFLKLKVRRIKGGV